MLNSKKAKGGKPTIQDRFWIKVKTKMFGHPIDVGRINLEINMDGLSEFYDAIEKINKTVEQVGAAVDNASDRLMKFQSAYESALHTIGTSDLFDLEKDDGHSS